jgi:16S rRNA (cytidine1402-2'-O)-methyltransferase
MVKQTLSNAPATLYIVATPIGNLDDMSMRAIDILKTVHRIAAEDTRHSRRLLQHYGINTPMLALHEHNEQRAADGIIHLLLQGRPVALISDAGTPLISDPGFPLVRACREQGIRVSPVPGPSAAIAALSVSGLPTDRFRFEGFLPRTQATRISRLECLKKETATLVFYESCHRISHSLEALSQVFGSERFACVARELTKQYEDVFHGSLAELGKLVQADEYRQKGEFVLVVSGATQQKQAVLPKEALDLLEVLVAELPLKQAAAIAAKVTGLKKNELYQAGLKLR